MMKEEVLKNRLQSLLKQLAVADFYARLQKTKYELGDILALKVERFRSVCLASEVLWEEGGFRLDRKV